MKKVIYEILKFFVLTFMRIVFNVKIVGKDKVQITGPYIVAANHLTNWDPVIITTVFYPPLIEYMSKIEMFRNKLVAKFLRFFGIFPIDRQHMGLTTMKEIDKIIERKGVIGIFPEGTRNKTGKKMKPKPGAASLSIKYQIPVVAVHFEWSIDKIIGIKRKTALVQIKKVFIPPKNNDAAAALKYINDIYDIIY